MKEITRKMPREIFKDFSLPSLASLIRSFNFIFFIQIFFFLFSVFLIEDLKILSIFFLDLINQNS